MAGERRQPGSSPAGSRQKAERQARLAEALRANLRKRKAQKRGQDDAAKSLDGEPAAGEPLEGGAKVK